MSSVKPLMQSDAELHWVDTFAFMPQGGLLFVSNKLDRLIFSEYNFSRYAEPNIRILLYENGAKSYISPGGGGGGGGGNGPHQETTTLRPEPTTQPNGAGDAGLTKDILIAVGCLAGLLPIITCFGCANHRKAKQLRRNQDNALAAWAADDSDDDALLEPEGNAINATLNASALAGVATMRFGADVGGGGEGGDGANTVTANGIAIVGYGDDDHVYE